MINKEFVDVIQTNLSKDFPEAGKIDQIFYQLSFYPGYDEIRVITQDGKLFGCLVSDNNSTFSNFRVINVQGRGQ